MMERLGKRLKQLREAYGYSGTFVADEIGCSANTLWQAEKGATKPNIELVANICTFYGISLDALVFGADEDFQQLVESAQAQGIDKELALSMEQLGYRKANNYWL